MHVAHHDVPGHIAMLQNVAKLIQFYGTAGDIGYRSERSKHATPAAWELYDGLQVDQPRVIICMMFKNTEVFVKS